MVDSRKEFSSLNHFGNGPQVGGDLNGNVIYEQLDAESKAALAQVSKDTPTLNRLLAKALRDGLISPDLVQALQEALNEDVLHVLTVVARHINEDVAEQLWYAAENLNKNGVQKFTAVSQDLTERVSEINAATDSLRDLLIDASTNAGVVSHTPGMDALPSPRTRDKWWFIPTLICGCCGAGLVAAVILMHSHLEKYALLVGIPMLIVAALLWGTNRRW